MHNLKRIVRQSTLGVVGAPLLAFTCQAQFAMVSIDMDNNLLNGIQNTLVSPVVGNNYTVAVVLQPAAAGVSSYGVSVAFDNTELTYVADAEVYPAGFGGVTPGVSGGPQPFGGPFTWVQSFTGFTFGLGPVGGNHVIGTITFQVGAVVNDGLADVTPFFFQPGVLDDMFNNAGVSYLPPGPGVVFNSGFVVPEPGATGAVLGGLALFAGLFNRRVRR